MTARVFFGLGEFEGLQNLVACCHGVRKALQSWRELFKFVPAEVAVGGAGGQDQIIVGDRHILPIGVTNRHALLILIHSSDLAQEHGRVLLFPENPTDRKANLTGSQNRRRHLVEQWLKQVVIRTIDHDNLSAHLTESLGDCQSPKPCANNYDSRNHVFTSRTSIRLLTMMPSDILDFPAMPGQRT